MNITVLVCCLQVITDLDQLAATYIGMAYIGMAMWRVVLYYRPNLVCVYFVCH